MAKKKNENTLLYMQMPLPQGRKYSKMTKVSFGGLNKRYTVDSGSLTMESNISSLEAPYVVPSQKHVPIDINKNEYEHPISMFGFDDFLLVIYRVSTSIYVDYIVYDADDDYYKAYTGVLQSGDASKNDEYPRCVVQFNVYETPIDPVGSGYTKELLIFPDKKSMHFNLEDLDKDKPDEGEGDGDFRIHDLEIKGSLEIPDIKYATVHCSRVFGVDDDRVYASGFNDYANWNLDTTENYNESNAWCSPSQSNTKAGGTFTGITTFQNHVVCFKRDFMHEIYNTKNPFRLQDIYAEGTIDNRTIQDVDGKLIFVSDDDVKVYTGSNPRIIGYNLNMPQYEYAVSGTDNRNYYLYCEDTKENKHLYVYDTYTDMWSEQYIDVRILGFAHNKTGMYVLYSDGYVCKMDTNNYYKHEWSFETDLITNKTVDIKHIKKLQMLVDIPEEINGSSNYSDAGIEVYILYDNEEFDSIDEDKRLVYSSTNKGKYPIRVKPRKTANYGFKLHVEGTGYVKLYELEIFIEAGGDLYV